MKTNHLQILVLKNREGCRASYQLLDWPLGGTTHATINTHWKLCCLSNNGPPMVINAYHQDPLSSILYLASFSHLPQSPMVVCGDSNNSKLSLCAAATIYT